MSPFDGRPRAWNSTLARGKPLAKKSKKRLAEEPERAALVARVLEAHPVCQIGLALQAIDHPQGNKCWGRSTEVHEFAKRSLVPGSHLREELTLATCRSCHDWTESGDPVVRELGFLVHSWEVDTLVAEARKAVQS